MHLFGLQKVFILNKVRNPRAPEKTEATSEALKIRGFSNATPASAGVGFVAKLAKLEEVKKMPTDRRTMDKLKRGYRDELAELEEKCKAGNATKQEYEQLTKLRRRMK